ALDAALLLENAADLAHVLFGEILDADVGADPGVRQDPVRAIAPDAVDIRQSNLDPLRARKIHACYTRHMLIPAAACVSGSGRSPARRRAGGRSCTCRKSV